MLSKHLNDALKKPAGDKRLIFIDVNTSFENASVPAWIERAGKKLDMKERSVSPERTAYVFVTNVGFHWHLDSEQKGQRHFSSRIGHTRFWKKGYFRPSEIYRRKQRHIDAHQIMEAFRHAPSVAFNL